MMRNDFRSALICRHVFSKLSQSSGLTRGRMSLKRTSSLGSNSIGNTGDEETESIVSIPGPQPQTSLTAFNPVKGPKEH